MYVKQHQQYLTYGMLQDIFYLLGTFNFPKDAKYFEIVNTAAQYRFQREEQFLTEFWNVLKPLSPKIMNESEKNISDNKLDEEGIIQVLMILYSPTFKVNTLDYLYEIVPEIRVVNQPN